MIDLLTVSTAGSFLAWGVVLAVYFAPTILAFARSVSSPWSIVVVNLFLGWTLIGWVISLAMAVRSVPAKA